MWRLWTHVAQVKVTPPRCMCTLKVQTEPNEFVIEQHPNHAKILAIHGNPWAHASSHFIRIASMKTSFRTSPTSATTSFIASTSLTPIPWAKVHSSSLSNLT